MRHPDVDKLKTIARDIRIDILTMLAEAKSGHPGGSLSSVEILVALYFYKLRHDPKNPDWDGRDRFLLSKGHVCPALYAVLSAAGYFPKKELLTLRKFGSSLQGHQKKRLSSRRRDSKRFFGPGAFNRKRNGACNEA